MGFFDFLKKKKNLANSIVTKPIVTPNPQGQFVLQINDFSEKMHQSEVLGVNLSPDFEKEFGHLVTGKPRKQGDIIELINYVARIQLWGKEVELWFDAEGIDVNTFLKKVNVSLSWLEQQQEPVCKMIINDLLLLKNGSWLDHNEPAYTEKTFLQRITPTSIDFSKNGSFKVSFDDGNLFSGHEIVITISSKNKLLKASVN
ncbi:DUF2262 domain-containing protein [Flavobacterium sp. MFBS3-15]|uniref:DUF2262 domain-containing protein n=1 Tax=Flavobacterium sp. MFBS3-15 TaxID=2989816 RepID=UPI00223648B5|nr:DUF2262 domain-containing protein [Flavobacterium sp. MFBS3-15]MCW4470180.1 DUF2262 domain-containing protein [Flavobacterium sp. MFBS3-15]